MKELDLLKAERKPLKAFLTKSLKSPNTCYVGKANNYLYWKYHIQVDMGGVQKVVINNNFVDRVDVFICISKRSGKYSIYGEGRCLDSSFHNTQHIFKLKGATCEQSFKKFQNICIEFLEGLNVF